MPKKQSKKKVKKIKEIKSKIKEIKKESKEEESKVEEKLEDVEQESSDSSFIRFIQNPESTLTHKEIQKLPQTPEVETLEDVQSFTRTQEKEENIEEYVVSSPEQYKEFARQQNIHSFNQSPEEILHTHSIGFDENIGRERHVIGREAHLINPEELIGVSQGRNSEDYNIVKPSQTGFTKESESSTIPFQNPRKTYKENL